MGSLSNLSIVLAYGCSSLVKLPSWIGHLSKLEKLWMGLSTERETLVDGNFGHAWKQLNMLYLRNCDGLVSAFNYGVLKQLLNLNLFSSTITELPESIGLMECLATLYISCEKLESLPNSIGDLQRLRNLHLRGCDKLKRLPETLGALPRLQLLVVGRCSIRKLPRSLGQLLRLEELRIEGCKSLKRLPASITQLNRLEKFELEGCGSIEAMGALTTLQGLSLWGRTSITKLPADFGIVSTLAACGRNHYGKECPLHKRFVGRGQLLEENESGFLRAYKDNLSGQMRLLRLKLRR